jgi:hypothetical protein
MYKALYVKYSGCTFSGWVADTDHRQTGFESGRLDPSADVIVSGDSGRALQSGAWQSGAWQSGAMQRAENLAVSVQPVGD